MTPPLPPADSPAPAPAPVLLRYALVRTTRRLTFDILEQAECVTYAGDDDGDYFKFTASNGYEVISRSRMDIQTERLWLLGAKRLEEQRSGSMVFSSNDKRDAAYAGFELALAEWARAHGGVAQQVDVAEGSKAVQPGPVPADVVAAAERLATPMEPSRIDASLAATVAADQRGAELILAFLRDLQSPRLLQGGQVAVSDVWAWAGGNPAITPSLQDLQFQLGLLNEICDDADALARASPAPLSDPDIVAIKRTARAASATQPWGDTLAFGRALLAFQDARWHKLIRNFGKSPG